MSTLYALVSLLTVLGLWGLWALVGGEQPDGDDERRYMVDDFVSSESLHLWASIYRSNHLHQRLTFGQFMRNPRGYLRALLFAPNLSDPFHVEPLLPRQRLVFERVLLSELHAEERRLQEDAQLRQLQRQYAEISTNDSRLYAPMHPTRKTRKWKTKGHFAHLTHKPA